MIGLRYSGSDAIFAEMDVKASLLLPNEKKSAVVTTKIPFGKDAIPCLPTASWKAALAARRQLTSRSNKLVRMTASANLSKWSLNTAGLYDLANAQNA